MAANRRRGDGAAVGDEWLREVAEHAGRAAGDVPVALLGDYLVLLVDAAVSGRRPGRRELNAVSALGRQAAEQGISAGRVVDLYLSAALRLWQDLPMMVRSGDSEVVRGAATAVLSVVEAAVATLAEGYAQARRDLVRREEALRREVIDDLLRGDSDLAGLVERVEPFGVDLGRTHQVAVAAPGRRLPDSAVAINALEAVVFQRLGDRDVLVAVKEGLLVVLTPADAAKAGHTSGIGNGDKALGRAMHGALSRLADGSPWLVAVGRPHPGLYGIARSYEEAREALIMAGRLRPGDPVVTAHDMLIYRVLLRDLPAVVDLVSAVLSPLAEARVGAQPLLDTLDAYFGNGTVATEAAKELHVSVRTVTYRLERIKTLTGYDPADPDHRFILEAAVRSAKVLNWPADALPAPV